MLPEEQGGVVDANLRVYGLANVRVADASVIPIALSTHLMSSTYGVAEQASDIIRQYYNSPEPEPAFSGSTSTPSSSAATAKKSGTARSNGSPAGNSGAALSLAWTSIVLVSAHAVVGYAVFV